MSLRLRPSRNQRHFDARSARADRARLEDRLHDMVCQGKLDLATAQRDISADWIAAYRKYFHVKEPVLMGSS